MHVAGPFNVGKNKHKVQWGPLAFSVQHKSLDSTELQEYWRTEKEGKELNDKDFSSLEEANKLPNPKKELVGKTTPPPRGEGNQFVLLPRKNIGLNCHERQWVPVSFKGGFQPKGNVPLFPQISRTLAEVGGRQAIRITKEIPKGRGQGEWGVRVQNNSLTLPFQIRRGQRIGEVYHGECLIEEQWNNGNGDGRASLQ